ncbi:MAG: hypothetical protein DME15_14625 [Candidatus Rokuibacteriota bacterium]|nr:MAG: hypothetical protein DME15_14625 [Candidatus Rokubacteria bacterium]
MSTRRRGARARGRAISGARIPSSSTSARSERKDAAHDRASGADRHRREPQRHEKDQGVEPPAPQGRRQARPRLYGPVGHQARARPDGRLPGGSEGARQRDDPLRRPVLPEQGPEVPGDSREGPAHRRGAHHRPEEMTDAVVSIDSSDPLTIEAGLEVHDPKKSRPFINSVNLEEGRNVLHAMAKEYNAYLAGNASGRAGMPYSAQERVDHLTELSKQMDEHGIPMEDRFLDALVFPVGAGPEFGMHYLDAIKQLRATLPDVHLFGGHSNVSFGLPERRVLNDAFLILSVLAGCDTLMVDPLMNPPKEYLEFKLAAEALMGRDEYSLNYIAYHRSRKV